VEVSNPCRYLVFLSETCEQFVQRQDEVGILDEGTDLIEQVEPYPPSGPLQRLTVSGVVDQDPAHRFGGGGEKVPSTIEVLVPDQPQVGLMDQRGGVEGISGLLRGHPRGGESSQLVVHERK